MGAASWPATDLGTHPRVASPIPRWALMCGSALRPSPARARTWRRRRRGAPGVAPGWGTSSTRGRPCPSRRGEPRLVGALAEREQSLSGVARRAHGLVGKDRQRARAELDPLARGQLLVAQPRGLRGGVGVVRGVADVVVAGPEAERDDLLRVGLLGDRVGVHRRAGPAGEAGHGEVEAVPEEVHGARLAGEPAAELLEHRVGPVEDPPEARDRVAIPGRVLEILGKRRRHGDAERLLGDLDVDVELAEQRVEAGVELRDGQSATQLERPGATVSRPDDHRVIDEVDRDLERGVVVMQPPRREPSHVDVQRDVPPVVARRRRGQPDLADDLAVEMQRVPRRAPVGQMQLRQRHGPHPTLSPYRGHELAR